MLNDLEYDPRIRERFQFWFFLYDTGNPIPYSALQLRNALRDAVADLDPQGKDPALRQMVVIGHSQGGLLTKMMVVDTGDALWRAVSNKPFDEVELKPEARQLLRDALFVKPMPDVREVIFIATPHRGSFVAGSRISQFVAGLVRLPGRVVQATADVIQQNPQAFPNRVKVGSVYGMTPGNPYIKAFAPIPIAPGVSAHSIIAVEGDGPVEQGHDGVVEYTSAHLDGVNSEFVVRSGHSAQSNPHTIEEVRRILLAHAAEACAGPVDCTRNNALERRMHSAFQEQPAAATIE
jgi:pimeloyl-ACP methyl ester carboxylesterase